jgi:ABC-type transport system substrate-binding protein
MTAEDVKFSLERLLSTELAAEGGSLYLPMPIVGLQSFRDGKAKEIVGLKAIDDLTFQIELERPESALLGVLSFDHPSVLPASYAKGMSQEKFNWAPIGTGPFMLESADPATGGRLVRHDEYWDPDRPHLDAVEVKFNVDPDLSLLRIQGGEQDIMLEQIPTAAVTRYRDDPSLKPTYYEGEQNSCFWLSLPTHIKPFGDKRVRQAIAMAIDKEKLVRIIKGLGTPATGGQFSPLSEFYTEGLAHPYDPKRAKELLTEAGFPEGVEVPFWAQNRAPYIDVSPVIQQDLAEIGIKAQICKPWFMKNFTVKRIVIHKRCLCGIGKMHTAMVPISLTQLSHRRP